jgi:hypothetical protein
MRLFCEATQHVATKAAATTSKDRERLIPPPPQKHNSEKVTFLIYKSGGDLICRSGVMLSQWDVRLEFLLVIKRRD